MNNSIMFNHRMYYSWNLAGTTSSGVELS